MGDTCITDPMTFLYLDMLSTILIDDTKELENQFETKLKFIREQEKICLENGKQLVFIDQFVETLKDCVYKLELELMENENELVQAERVISHCEAMYMDPMKCPKFNTMPFKHSCFLVLMKLLLSADRSAAQANLLKAEIERFNTEAGSHLEPINMITKIIDYHRKSLVLMEQEINKLESMTKDVTNSYDQITKQMQISSLTTKCTLTMANVINDIYYK
ncbi:uncharacterized protein LOC117573316 [Drosophila albomicans]|uniref:Uncharacterized protein LOC117573316 n=1 Tax=Drosophila albomicans TaxID=7291 RepID=A0A6P8XLP8_DROAB|nr:uncharacterized protein LOC117573316 [Drosophila albomicans]